MPAAPIHFPAPDSPEIQEWLDSAAENDRLAAGHRKLALEAEALGMPGEAARQTGLARQRDADARHNMTVVEHLEGRD